MNLMHPSKHPALHVLSRAALALSLSLPLFASAEEEMLVEDPSLIVNGGFESGHLRPFTSFGALLTSQNEDVAFGRHAVRLNRGTGLVASVAVKPSTRYVFSVWGRVEREGEWLRIGVNGINGRRDDHNAGLTSTRWTETRIEFTTGPEDQRVDVFAFKDHGIQPGFVDEFTMVEVR